jgi:hypothetical protein
MRGSGSKAITVTKNGRSYLTVITKAITPGGVQPAPWSTGPNGALGPDVLLFPGQRAWVNAFGYDDDWVFDDSLGRISRWMPQVERSWIDASCCGGHPFLMKYRLEHGANPPPPSLSEAAKRFYRMYRVGGSAWKLPAPLATPSIHVSDAVLKAAATIRKSETPFFEPQECEMRTLPCAPLDALQRDIAALDADPASQTVLTGLLGAIKTQEMLARAGSDRSYADAFNAILVGPLRSALRPQTYDASFSDVFIPPAAIVYVTDERISPSSLVVSQRTRVTWRFTGLLTNEIRDLSGLRLFASPKSRATFTFPFMVAGSWLVGQVSSPAGTPLIQVIRVPMLSQTSGSTATLIWSAVPPPPGTAFDVDIQVPGTTGFQPWRVGTSSTSARFSPLEGGRYLFRARLRKLDSLRVTASGWSPTLAVDLP